jgi:hypothetical protein
MAVREQGVDTPTEVESSDKEEEEECNTHFLQE